MFKKKFNLILQAEFVFVPVEIKTRCIRVLQFRTYTRADSQYGRSCVYQNMVQSGSKPGDK